MTDFDRRQFLGLASAAAAALLLGTESSEAGPITVGKPVKVGPTSTQNLHLARSSSGKIVAGYMARNANGHDHGYFGVVPLSGQEQVRLSLPQADGDCCILPDPDGGYLAVYRVGRRVFSHLITDDGSLSGEPRQILRAGNFISSLNAVRMKSGAILVGYAEGGDIYKTCRAERDGSNPARPRQIARQISSNVNTPVPMAALSGGGAVVIFRGGSLSGGTWGGWLIGDDGVKHGKRIAIDGSDHSKLLASDISVAALPRHQFVISWYRSGLFNSDDLVLEYHRGTNGSTIRREDISLRYRAPDHAPLVVAINTKEVLVIGQDNGDTRINLVAWRRAFKGGAINKKYLASAHRTQDLKARVLEATSLIPTTPNHAFVAWTGGPGDPAEFKSFVRSISVD